MVTARHYDELRREVWRATGDCAANTLDLQVLIEGDESPPSGFILYRDSPEDVSGLTATSSDGASTWDVGRVDGRSLGEFRVSPDGTQVLAEAFSRRDGASRLVVAGVADLRSGAADPWHTIGPDDDQWGQGRWSRDGRRIIGMYGPYTARRLAVLEIDTGRVTDLGEPAGWSSAFAPGAVFDESVIVSGGPTGGVLQRVDLASGTWVEILDLPACAIADTIEIDDERLFLSVSCVDQRTSGIYSVGSDGSDLRAVFTGVNSSIPRLSADGEWMAMNLQEPLAERLDPRPWIARVDGTQARQLSDGWAGYATWIDG